MVSLTNGRRQKCGDSDNGKAIARVICDNGENGSGSRRDNGRVLV